MGLLATKGSFALRTTVFSPKPDFRNASTADSHVRNWEGSMRHEAEVGNAYGGVSNRHGAVGGESVNDVRRRPTKGCGLRSAQDQDLAAPAARRCVPRGDRPRTGSSGLGRTGLIVGVGP
jgi:hypothetical protein